MEIVHENEQTARYQKSEGGDNMRLPWLYFLAVVPPREEVLFCSRMYLRDLGKETFVHSIVPEGLFEMYGVC